MKYFIIVRKADKNSPNGFDDDYDFENDMFEEDEHSYYKANRFHEDPYVMRNSDYSKDYREYWKPTSKHYALPNKSVANEVMLSAGFSEYVHKHGYHFTPELAQTASRMMVNRNGVDHHWSASLIKDILRLHNYTDFSKCTLGDITYLANMAYADFYPHLLKDEISCIKYATSVAKDPDGYEGVAFSRWVADLIGKEFMDIKWKDFV